MTRRRVALFFLPALLLLVSFVPPLARAAGRGEPGEVFPVEIRLTDRRAELATLGALDIDVDAVFHDRARAFVLEEEARRLAALGFDLARIDDPAPRLAREAAAGPVPERTGESIPAAYHTYATLTSELQAVAAARPDLVRLDSIGQSVQGRQLWIAKISRNPDLEEDEPEFAYIGGIHGDEVVGKELSIGLIHHLVDAYGTDPRVTSLVDGTEIWILPSMNPDGTEAGTRYNAGGFDLNRSFPDEFSDPVNTTTGRPPEVAAVMNWQNAHSTILSGSYHGGALVVNYPRDGNAAGTNVYSSSPDDPLLVSHSRTYADRNPPLLASNSDSSWVNGICNGADWYTVRGGMQDWNYVWRANVHYTLEIGNTKWPAAATLPQYWADNLDSMLALIERTREGVRGVVTDAVTGAPLAATVRVLGYTLAGAPAAVSTDPDAGDYHRMLLPGTYDLEVAAPGYITEKLAGVVVGTGVAVRRDVALRPSVQSLEPFSNIVLDSGGNGLLEAGETATVTLTLKNYGNLANAVSGRLVSLSPFVSVTRPQASFGNIGSNLTGASKSPHFALAVAASFPEGHKAGFVLEWTSSGSSGTTSPFYLPLGARTCTTFAATNVPRPIADRSTAVSTLSVASPLEMEEANVYVQITHPNVGDLTVTAVAPSARQVVLHNRSGSGANLQGWFDTDRSSFEPLERLAGESPTGTWTLRAYDGAPGGTGSLAAWSVQVCGRPYEATPPEVTLRGGSKRGGNGVIEWYPYPGLTGYRVYRSTLSGSEASFVDVTSSDADTADAAFEDPTDAPILYYIVTGVSSRGEGPWGHFGR